MMRYENPVIRGFYPDPSVCKAGGKYYLVCSSFHYFPAVPLFESEDLINWTQIGCCLTEKSQIDLEGVPASGGIFAPTIRCHNGRFYVVTTDDTRHENFYVYTDDIYRKWSDPVYVKQGGIDPSLYIEGDRVIFTSNGRDENDVPCIYQCDIDIETGERLTESRVIWKGSGGRLVEGPHLYKRDGLYYLIAAEGGTEYGHMVTCARAETPYGPFEGCPDNPVLTNRDLGDDEIQGAGHGDLIEDENGNWWMVHLAFRQIARWRQYHHLGREVFLEPVAWKEDGWFTVGKNKTARKEVCIDRPCESIVQRLPSAADFAEEGWHESWSFLRNPERDRYRFGKGVLKICAGPLSLCEAGSPAFIGLRQQEFENRLTVSIKIPGGEAGVSVYMDEKHHYDIGARNAKGGLEYLCRLCVGGIREEIFAPASAGLREARIEIVSCRDCYVLRIKEGERVCLERRTESKYLSSEVAGGFTGVLFGLYAYDVENNGAWCEFRDFQLEMGRCAGL